jgi:hypothetical protein
LDDGLATGEGTYSGVLLIGKSEFASLRFFRFAVRGQAWI